MKPGPSSVRLFSKCTQSTMSRASSLTLSSSSAGSRRLCSTHGPDRGKGVNFSLAAALVERVGAATELQPQRNRTQIEVAPHRVQQVAAVALRKLLKAVAEHHEA